MRRALVLVACLVLAVVVVLLAQGRVDEENSETKRADQTPATTATESRAKTTTGTTLRPQPSKSLAVKVEDGQVAGGPKTLRARKGEPVRISVVSDAAGAAHLHGYDLEKPLRPGQPTVFAFEARLVGAFELELHAHPPRPLVELQVRP